MASTVRLDVDIRDLYRDLEAAANGLEAELTKVLGDGAALIAETARPLMRRSAAGSWDGSSGAELGHIQDSYGSQARGLTATVTTSHPGAPVWEYGGRIAPRAGEGGVKAAEATGHPREIIDIPRQAPVHRAALADIDVIEQQLKSSVDRLLASFNL